MYNIRDVNKDFLWKSFLNGDDNSFAIIYQQYIDSLLSYGQKLCTDKELVQDCIQEMFVDLFLKRDKLPFQIENLKPYLFVTLRNNLIKKINKSRKFESVEINKVQTELQFNVEYSIQEKVIENEFSDEIKKKLKLATNNLPPKQKEIIYLKFEEGLEYGEISEIMKISIESARKLLYRSLVSLRKVVKSSTFQVFFNFFLKK